MTPHSWIEEFPAAVTVCDKDGIILEMNARAAQVFASDGGKALIGRCLFDCHSAASVAKLNGMMDGQQKNVYTIEKKGVRKLVYQSPWFDNGQYAGFVEISFEIPTEMPHFIRG